MKAEAIEARAECGSRDCKGDYMGAEYRQKWLSSLGGYVVYRHWFDIEARGVAVERHATAHKTAVFVCESEAADYCEYRNEMMRKYGTDDVAAIVRPSDESNRTPREAGIQSDDGCQRSG